MLKRGKVSPKFLPKATDGAAPVLGQRKSFSVTRFSGRPVRVDSVLFPTSDIGRRRRHGSSVP